MRELTFWEVDILGVSILRVDILGVDILGVDILGRTLLLSAIPPPHHNHQLPLFYLD